MGRKCIYVLVLQIWKPIPDEMKSLTSVDTFKKTKNGLHQTFPVGYAKPKVDVGFITETSQMNICFSVFPLTSSGLVYLNLSYLFHVIF